MFLDSCVCCQSAKSVCITQRPSHWAVRQVQVVSQKKNAKKHEQLCVHRFIVHPNSGPPSYQAAWVADEDLDGALIALLSSDLRLEQELLQAAVANAAWSGLRLPACRLGPTGPLWSWPAGFRVGTRWPRVQITLAADLRDCQLPNLKAASLGGNVTATVTVSQSAWHSGCLPMGRLSLGELSSQVEKSSALVKFPVTTAKAAAPADRLCCWILCQLLGGFFCFCLLW